MNRAMFAGLLAFVVVVCMVSSVKGNGNPLPGFPHDTINIHVQKSESGPKDCDGGHSLFLRTENGVFPEDTILNINMIDWNQVDNDGDGLFDEDPLGDANNDGQPGIAGVDDDGDGDIDEGDVNDDDEDGEIDEDGLEPGAVTKATDCDSYLDHEVSLQIRDTDPREGIVST